MKNLFNNISMTEKERIIEMHKSATKKQYLKEVHDEETCPHCNGTGKNSNFDEGDMFYKVIPDMDFWYNKKNKSHTGDFDFDYDEEEYEDFDEFMQKYPYQKKQNWFPHNEMGKSWFEGYKSNFPNKKFPVRVRKS